MLEKYNLAIGYALDKKGVIREGIDILEFDAKEKIKDLLDTELAYLDPGLRNTVNSIGDTLLHSMPSFRFTYNVDAKMAHKINIALRKLIRNFKLNFKLGKMLYKSLIHGTVVAELVYDENKIETTDGDVFYSGGKIDIVVYDMLRNNILIDPLADPEDIRGTARWILIRHGIYSPEEFVKVLKKYDYTMSEEDVERLAGVHDDIFLPDERPKGRYIELWKVYRNDGLIEFWANKTVHLFTIPNNKKIKGMPLIIFEPFPSEKNVYGLTLYEILEQFIIYKTAIINLSLENAMKNIMSPLITDSAELARKANLQKIRSDEIVLIENIGDAHRSVADRFSQLKYADFTPALAAIYNIIATDQNKTAGTSNIEFGFQDKQVRNSTTAQLLMQNSINAKSKIVNYFENQVLAPMARDILLIVYNNYEQFLDFIQEVPKEVFKKFMFIDVLNGSTLPEDQERRLQTFVDLIQLAIQNPTEFDLSEILADFFEERGFNIESYFSSPQKSLMKDLLSMNIPLEKAQMIYQMIMEAINVSQSG